MERLSPMVQRHKEWEQDRRAGGLRSPGNVLIPIVKCTRCHIYIGRGYICTEIYLYPTGAVRRKLVWKPICEWCAVTELYLPFGYCLLAHDDWSGPYRSRLQLGEAALPVSLIAYKAKLLDQTVVPQWNRYVKDQKEHHLQTHPNLMSFPRQRLLRDFLPTIHPEPVTYTALMEDSYDAAA